MLFKKHILYGAGWQYRRGENRSAKSARAAERAWLEHPGSRAAGSLKKLPFAA